MMGKITEKISGRKIGRLALCWCLLILASCNTADKISIDSLNDVRIEGVSLTQARFTLELTVRNDSGRNVSLEEGEFVLSDPKGERTTISLRERVEVPKRSMATVSVPLTAKFQGVLGAASAFELLNGEIDRMNVSGTVTVKSGAVRKKIPLNDIPLGRLMKMFEEVDGKSLNLPF